MTIAYIQTRVDKIKQLADEIAAYAPDPVTPVPNPGTNPISGLLDLVDVYSLGNVRYMGRNMADHFLARSYWEATQIIADVLVKQFPNRTASKLEIVRACPKVYTGPDTHTILGYQCDFHYFTMADTNHTQIGSFGEPLINIWEEGELTKLFDADRTLACMESFKLIFPDFQICTVPKIAEAMGAGRGYDWIGTGLDAPKWHHDTHWHGCIWLKDPIPINKEAVL